MNILFTGIGGPTPLGIAKSVKVVWPNYRCIGLDASIWARSHYQSDVFDATYLIPNAQASGYWEAIEEIIKIEKIDFAFIVPETEVLAWAERAKTHELPCRAHLPQAGLANFCFDKSKVADLLFDLGLTPKTVKISFVDMERNTIKLEYPFWIRINTGAGALGALKINEYKDMVTWMAMHKEKSDFIGSEYLPGRNYACKLLYKSGKLIQSSSAERIEYLLSAAAPSGISGMCARGRLLNRQDLVKKSKKALETISNHVGIPLNGMFTVDFKENKQGEAMITEVNIRHVSFTYAFTLGGVNFSESTLRLFFDPKFEKAEVNGFKSEDYFIRGVDAPICLVNEKELKY